MYSTYWCKNTYYLDLLWRSRQLINWRSTSTVVFSVVPYLLVTLAFFQEYVGSTPSAFSSNRLLLPQLGSLHTFGNECHRILFSVRLYASSLWLLLQNKNDQRKTEPTLKLSFLLWGDHFPPAQRSLGWDHFHFLFLQQIGGTTQWWVMDF